VFDACGIAFDIVDPLQRDASSMGDGDIVDAPMPGLVKAVNAKAGQSVTAGDRLVVLEAMKMEHALLASRDGFIAAVLVSEGDQVEAGAALIRLEEIDT
jgi:3-methylcrotonyl-CoA carboxylase alpha subunit